MDEISRLRKLVAYQNAQNAQLADQNAQLADQLAKQEEVFEDQNAQLADQLAKQEEVSLQKLWSKGIQGVTCRRKGSALSTHTSNHLPVNIMVDENKFVKLDDKFISQENLTASSLFLLNMQQQDNINVVSYFNESGIEDHVRYIIKDVLHSLGINRQVSIHYQATLIGKIDGKRKESKSDIWVVKTLSGVPIAIVEVKQPGRAKMNNKRVLGQVFDYMCNLRNSFGQCEVFGIVTTLEQWRVCWLPDTNNFAASTTLVPQQIDNLTTVFSVDNTLLRTICCGDIYELGDPQLLSVIASVFLKSMKSHYRVVSLLSPCRAYTILSKSDWYWGTISDAELAAHDSLMLTLPKKLLMPPKLKVLRQFHGGADGQVCLALTESFDLVVVKKFYESAKCKREFDLWKELYEVGVLQVELVGSQALIMPFVFHCVQGENEELTFNFNLSYWGKHQNSLLEDDGRFISWTSKINAFMGVNDITVSNALIQAVNLLAKKHVVHNDLVWRHVALLPQFSEDGKQVEGMKPILIDLASANYVETESTAMEYMQEGMNELLEELEDR